MGSFNRVVFPSALRCATNDSVPFARSSAEASEESPRCLPRSNATKPSAYRDLYLTFCRSKYALGSRQSFQQNSQDMNLPITGGCICKAVRYESTAEPIMMVKCHCRDCQQITGGPYTPAVIFPFSAFRVTQGKIQHYATQSQSGESHLRGFCPQCGSRLTGAENPERGIIGVAASSLDDPSIFKATMEFFVEDAQPWDLMEEATQKFAQSFPG